MLYILQGKSGLRCSLPNLVANLVANLVIAMQLTRADAPSWGRALALAGMYVYAGNHWGMPCTLGQSQLKLIATQLPLKSYQTQ